MPLYKILSNDRRLQLYQAIELGEKYKEENLEDWIEANPEVLIGDEPLLIIGRQVNTSIGIIDLLALDSNGAGIIIELKRAPSQRDAVSQSVEYASWLSALEADELKRIAQEYLSKVGSSDSLEKAWANTFGSELRERNLNNIQRLFIVIEGENDRLTSMVRYLRSSGLDISLLSYNFFRTETGEEILHIEFQAGDMETASEEEPRPSESRLIESWTESVVEAYEIFREEMFSKGLYARPVKSGISFKVQTRERSTFVCFFNSSDSDVSVWLRNDSLQALIDFNKASESIKNKAPKGSQFTHSPTWFIVRFIAKPENARDIAKLILTEVVDRLLEN